ncbi:MAG: VWA domain-containing protein [Phycisphaerales bacterium]|nr:VWA domain-containing protein [Phycisphaerales bacterium]
MHFASPELLNALWGLPVLGGLLVWGLLRRRAAAAGFVERGLLDAMGAPSEPRRWTIKACLVLSAAALLAGAAARPQWGETQQQIRRSGRDVVFVVDVSRSMLATDVKPSRLERAKLWVEDAVAALSGDRAALVAFAGNAVVKCPLTADYSFLRMAVRDLSSDSVTRGGTNLGDAIRLAVRDAFERDAQGNLLGTRFRDIVLITDGEDQDSLPLQAAEQAGKIGVRIIAIGMGDAGDGARIPVQRDGRGGFLEFEGREVFTRLRPDTLRDLALATPGGKFFPVATGDIRLDEVLRPLLRDRAPAEAAGASDTAAPRYTERFQWFLLVAILLLIGDVLIHERRRAQIVVA